MEGNIKGIVIEIGGDTQKLNKALEGVNKQSKDIQGELKQVERLLKLDPTNTILLAQKEELLAKAVSNTKDKLDTLKEAEKQVQKQFEQGKVGEEQYRAIQREVISTEQNLNKLESQGKETNDVLSDEKPASNLKNIGIAAGAAAVAAGAALVGMANAALESADETQRLSDVTGLSSERLQELQYAGNNLGVELETITGAQAKLTKSMAAAQEGTGAQAEAFAALGISVTDSNGGLRDAKDVMSEAFTALNGVGNETERDALSMQIFGKSAMEMNPLIKAGGDELNRLSEEARANGAVMSNEAVAGLDTFGDTMDNIKNGILGAFGEKLAQLMPTIQELLGKLQELPQWIQDNTTKLEIIGVVIGTITALIIAFNIQQALMASGLTVLTAIEGVATAVTTALGTAFAFLTSPIGLVILAIAALVAAGVLLYQNWDTIKASLTAAWTAISTSVTTIWGSILQFFSELPGKISGFFTEIINTFTQWGTNAISWVTTTIPQIINNIADFFSQLPGKIGYALGYALGTLLKWGLDAVNWATTEVPKIIENIIKFFSELPGKIEEHLKTALTNLGTWASNMVNTVTTEVPKIINKVVDFFKGLPGKVGEQLSTVISNFVTWASNMVSSAASEVPKIISSIVSFFSELPGDLLDIGENMVRGLWDGISGMGSWIQQKIREFASGLVAGMKAALGIHSPSTVFAGIGENISAGLAVGIENGASTAQEALANTINELTGLTELTMSAQVNGTTGSTSGAGAPSLTIVNKGTVIGSNGMNELADVISRKIAGSYGLSTGGAF